MSIVLEEKLATPNMRMAESFAVDSISIIKSVLLSTLLVTTIAGAAIFAARSATTISMTEPMSMQLAYVGAGVCFLTLPLLVVFYRMQKKLALVTGSVMFFLMVFVASVIH